MLHLFPFLYFIARLKILNSWFLLFLKSNHPSIDISISIAFSYDVAPYNEEQFFPHIFLVIMMNISWDTVVS